MIFFGITSLKRYIAMRLRTISKTCLAFLCLSLNFSATGSPQDCGAAFYMKEIILNQGKVALVDDSDFEYLNQWKWSLKSHYGRLFYAQRNQWIAGGKGKQIRYLMHRVILNVTDGKIIVDHKNGNGLDNQRHNLRLSDKSTNAFNAVGHRDKKHSKFKGVTFDFEKDKWVSQISVKGKRTMKRFDTEIEAALFYNEKAKELHGEFANLNSIYQ